jgi:hypothetical protein
MDNKHNYVTNVPYIYSSKGKMRIEGRKLSSITYMNHILLWAFYYEAYRYSNE